MIIRVDLHFLPENLKSLIINSKELTQYAINDECVSESSKVESSRIQLFEFNGFFASFKGILKLVLQNNSMDDYIVVEDLECDNTFVILKKGDIEQLGLLLCDFCGLACANEDVKYIHQRAHYFM